MSKEGAIAVIERTKKRSASKGWGVSIEADALDVCPSPVLVVDLVSKAVIEAHRTAIEAGVQADSGKSQPEITGQGERDALRGKRPMTRGVTAKRYFLNKFGRNKIRVSRKPIRFGKGQRSGGGTIGVSATCDIVPPLIGNWLEKEAERGVEYFFVGGWVDDAVEAALKQAVEQMTGGPVEVDEEARESQDAKAKAAGRTTLVRPWNN